MIIIILNQLLINHLQYFDHGLQSWPRKTVSLFVWGSNPFPLISFSRALASQGCHRLGPGDFFKMLQGRDFPITVPTNLTVLPAETLTSMNHMSLSTSIFDRSTFGEFGGSYYDVRWTWLQTLWWNINIAQNAVVWLDHFINWEWYVSLNSEYHLSTARKTSVKTSGSLNQSGYQ